ncbi:hypothetical protein GY21_15330 [Cryobacterium roopkundense]|uniref:Uncharacterized protein n=1 Tax=Cryobacterium roopkundense TaxID=1001240 RepID=A0A099J320_9MICO|nr:hypothetical protein GY21_15330 [Cryobacterium roopkundense]
MEGDVDFQGGLVAPIMVAVPVLDQELGQLRQRFGRARLLFDIWLSTPVELRRGTSRITAVLQIGEDERA